MQSRRVRQTLLGTLLVVGVFPDAVMASTGMPALAARARPLPFEPNRGQSHPSVCFSARGRRFDLHLTSGGSALMVVHGAGSSEAALLGLRLLGADEGAPAVGALPLASHSNYFLGNDPGAWRTNVPHYGRVDFHEVYPGIGLSYYGHEGRVEYDFLVAPGADPKRIRLRVEGAQDVRIDEHGSLVLSVPGGELFHHAPLLYQDVAGERRLVTGRYVRYGTRDVGFQIGEYDSKRPLVIDPVLSYSTYLGGDDEDLGTALAVDSTGYLYVTGITRSLDFPVANPYQAGNPGYYSVFVAKLNPAGSALVYSTYLGGSGFDSGLDVAIDSAGNAYVTGETDSTNFPTVNPLQPSNAGGAQPFDAFVAKLSPSGSALLYSTYLGGSGYDRGESLRVDSSGNMYLAGPTTSTDFPLAKPIQHNYAGGEDAFVAKLNAAGSALAYSTYLGGNSLDYAVGVSVDATGNAYVVGWTSSDNFPIANALQPTKRGVNDAFISKLDPSGSAFVYSTFLGGQVDNFGVAIAADSSGNAYATGYTYSADFPTVNAAQPTLAGEDDVFVAKLNPTGSGLLYSTYLGGSGFDAPSDLTLDSLGRVHVTGFTASTDFPTVAPLQAAQGGNEDAFVAALTPAGSAFAYSTYLGGSDNDVGYGIASGPSDDVYVTGYTSSTNFPTATPLQATNAGSQDAFIARVAEATPVELMRLSID